MNRISLKSILFPFLGIAAALVIGACIQPVDMDKFNNDPDVQDLIRSTRVSLIDKTGDGLRSGDKTITGLNANKFYLVETWGDEPDEPPSIAGRISSGFVGEDGSLGALANIDNVTDRVIRGLNNDDYFVVYSATPLTGSLTIRQTSGGTPTTVTANNSGILTLDANRQGFILDLSVNDAISAGSVSFPTALINGRELVLEAEDTTTEYFFHDDTNPAFFKFLTVIIKPSPPTGDLTITVTGLNFTDRTATLSPTTMSWSNAALVAGTQTINVTIDNATLLGMTNIEWRYDGYLLSSISTANLAIDFSPANIDNVYNLLNLGNHTISLEFNVGGVRYSTNFVVTITP